MASDEASSAEDAIALMRTGHPDIDVVFTDIQLAGRLCGWDVAEQCRARRADFPVIYASGKPLIGLGECLAVCSSRSPTAQPKLWRLATVWHAPRRKRRG